MKSAAPYFISPFACDPKHRQYRDPEPVSICSTLVPPLQCCHACDLRLLDPEAISVKVCRSTGWAYRGVEAWTRWYPVFMHTGCWEYVFSRYAAQLLSNGGVSK